MIDFRSFFYYVLENFLYLATMSITFIATSSSIQSIQLRTYWMTPEVTRCSTWCRRCWCQHWFNHLIFLEMIKISLVFFFKLLRWGSQVSIRETPVPLQIRMFLYFPWPYLRLLLTILQQCFRILKSSKLLVRDVSIDARYLTINVRFFMCHG